MQSACGLCPNNCTASCQTKTCGNSPDDGCGGTCVGYCNDGDTGCTSSSQCKLGSVCSASAAPYYGQAQGTMACWPAQCETLTSSARDCGKSNSVCGPVCPGTSGQCANRQCGTDPDTGASCGTCTSSQFCNGNGQCQALSTDIINSGATGSTDTTQTIVATDVGAIPGNLTITPHGKANYSIELFVPPGVHGLAPRLSLEYQSDLHEGEVGTGWHLGGLSQITRCPKSMAQGGPSPVTYTDDDQYCLDGLALMRASASYGDGAEYRLQNDPTVRAKVYVGASNAIYAGPDHFDVYSPDGRVSRYGGSVYTRGSLSEPNQNVGVYNIWVLREVSDPQGNSIHYMYASDSYTTNSGPKAAPLPGHPDDALTLSRGIRPVLTLIAYGGSSSAPPNRTISFEREDIPVDAAYMSAQRYGWTSGYPYRLTQRIKSISMYYETTKVRKNSLQYEADTRHNKLSTVSECSQGHCKQPTVLTYKQPWVFNLPHNDVNKAIRRSSKTTPFGP